MERTYSHIDLDERRKIARHRTIVQLEQRRHDRKAPTLAIAIPTNSISLVAHNLAGRRT